MREIGVDNSKQSGFGVSIETKLSQFLSKVMSYMALGLLLSAVVSYYIMTVPSIGAYFFYEIYGDHGKLMGVELTYLWYGVALAEFIAILAISFIRTTSYKVTLAIYLTYSAMIGITISPLITMFEISSVISILLMTTAIFAVFAVYGFVTKRDLTKFGSILSVSLICLILASLVNIFLQSPILHYVLTWVGVVIFIIYIAHDMQNIKNVDLNADNLEQEAILGALNLYLDFINLFIRLLSLFGKRR